jgi:hypothetical protein
MFAMHWLKQDIINPNSVARVGATCGDAFFAYRSGSELTKETPPPR